MRTKVLILIGGLALILGPASGLSQFPSGGGKGKSKGGRGGFGSRSSAPGQPGGGRSSFGGRFSPGAPGTGAPSVGGRSFPGGTGTGAPSMGGRSLPGGPGGGSPFGSNSSRDPYSYQQFQAARSSGAPAGFPSSTGSRFGGGDSRRGSDWSPEGLFQRFDRNGDGVLNHDEMSDDLRAERNAWDRDENGFIDPREFTDYFRARMDYLREERGGPSGAPRDGPLGPQPDESRPVVYRAGRLPQGMPPWFAQYDRDADAQVGLYEWKSSGRPIHEFEGMDRNDDGFITIVEVLRLTASPQPLGPDRSGPSRGGSPGTAVASRSSPGRPGGGGPGRGSPGMMGGRFGSPGGSRAAGPGGSGRSGPPSASSGSSRFGSSGRSGSPSFGNRGRSGPGSGSSGRFEPGGRSSGSGGR